MPTFQEWARLNNQPYNDTGWAAYVASGQSGHGQGDISEARQRLGRGLSTGGSAETGFQGASAVNWNAPPPPLPAPGTPYGGVPMGDRMLGPGGGSWPAGYMPRGGGPMATIEPWQQGPERAASWPRGYMPGGGQMYGQPFAQMPMNQGGQPYNQMARQIRAPRPHQVNPMVWDSLAPSGRQLALGLAEDTGYDAGDYEHGINQTRPRGFAPRQTNYSYGAPRGVGARF